MADYDAMDDESLQERLAQASSYEERSAIRQVIRKRKKEHGQASKGESRGRSSYNRFAGSTASKTSGGSVKSFEIPASARSQHSSVPELKPVPKQEKKAPSRRQHSPPPTSPDHISSQPTQPEEAVQDPEEVEQTPEVVGEEAQDTEEVEEEIEEAEQEIEEAEQEADEAELEEQSEEAERALEETDKPPVTEEPAEDVSQDTAEEGERAQVSEEVDAGPRSEERGLQQYLVAYVNKELQLDPPLPSQGKNLYDTCSDATVLCKLINKSVAGTVDLRALSNVRGNAAQRREAVEDNMTLVVESARAIGCKVKDDTAEQIIQKDPGTINNFLVDLIRARVVHLPGMEDEPSSSFSNWNYLFEKLKISVDNTQGGSGREEAPVQQSWRESTSDSPALTYEQRAARRKAEREQRQREKEAEGSVSAVGLTYEERAQQRKAERERRRREREALAK